MDSWVDKCEHVESQTHITNMTYFELNSKSGRRVSN